VLRNAHQRKQALLAEAEKCNVIMITVMDLRGWGAQDANEILGAKVFVEPAESEKVPSNGKAD
jgi:hypothetical protein